MELKNLILGFDFGEKESQICCYSRAEKDAVSIPVRKGSIEEEFPTVLFKKPGEDQWYAADGEKREGQEEADLLAQLISKGARVSSYRREEGNLEELFLRLTEGEDHNAGKPIREKDSY